MEGQVQSHSNNELDGGSSNNNTKAAGAGGMSGFMCRQSSTRWTPTSEQIRILKDLYYNNGIRSPSADQIQRISARLRQYGKIEGKNVFYWFQNHKARERQKKRFTTVTTTTSTNAAPPQYDHRHHNIIQPPFQRHNHNNSNNNNNALNPAHWRSSDQADHPPFNLYNNNYPPPNGVVPCPSSSPGVFTAVGQGSYGYGSVAMEQSFRDCSISPKVHNSTGGSIGQNISVPSSYPFLGKINSVDDHETLEEEEEEEEEDEDDNQAGREIETLPLFPMHGEEYSSGFSCSNNNNHPESSTGHYYTSGWYQSDINGSARASLELSLNSFITGSRSTDHQLY